MQFTKLTKIVLMTLVVVCMAGIVNAADSDPVTVAGILEAAGCPLTAAQEKQIADYVPRQRGQGADTGAPRVNIYEIFDEKQTAALTAKLGEQPARGDRPPRIRSLTQVIALEKADCPLTEKQVADLKNLDMSQGGFQAMQEIYTEEQREAVPMRGGRGGQN